MGINDGFQKKFGLKLSYVRKLRKLSQMKLAEKVNMSDHYIGQIERGEANLTFKSLKVIADTLEVDIKELFDFSF